VGGWNVGFGGDTLNTAVHLVRAGHGVGYLTALGTDGVSRDLRVRWAAEGLDCEFVLAHPDRLPGVYAISVDGQGERTFSYWRSQSAAREMFALPAMAEAAARAAAVDLFLFSLITLAILPETGRAALLALCRQVRAQGGKVVFDGNYRPALWPSAGEASHWRDQAVALADIGLPTLDDEQALGLADHHAVAAYWQGIGCGEVVVKLGAQGCFLPDGGVIPPPVVVRPVDTSGAGDAFNAGYLSARLNGGGRHAAALAGHAAAGRTIAHPGAILPRPMAQS
jgi:2-dehydro-3-deoxygluconokinase